MKLRWKTSNPVINFFLTLGTTVVYAIVFSATVYWKFMKMIYGLLRDLIRDKTNRE